MMKDRERWWKMEMGSNQCFKTWVWRSKVELHPIMKYRQRWWKLRMASNLCIKTCVIRNQVVELHPTMKYCKRSWNMGMTPNLFINNSVLRFRELYFTPSYELFWMIKKFGYFCLFTSENSRKLMFRPTKLLYQWVSQRRTFTKVGKHLAWIVMLDELFKERASWS